MSHRRAPSTRECSPLVRGQFVEHSSSIRRAFVEHSANVCSGVRGVPEIEISTAGAIWCNPPRSGSRLDRRRGADLISPPRPSLSEGSIPPPLAGQIGVPFRRPGRVECSEEDGKFACLFTMACGCRRPIASTFQSLTAGEIRLKSYRSGPDPLPLSIMASGQGR